MLDGMNKLVRSLGYPQRDAKAIHIAGTKGKGSTSAIIHSILKSAGFKTGLYTSPHLVSFRERIKINDVLISEEDVARLMTCLRKVIGHMPGETFSFFEVYTALAYIYFSEKKSDFAVYEVGLGGRLDATNVVDPFVCAITPISYEHTDKLGSTLGQIAGEKAGIIKQGSICVSAPQEKEALKAIVDTCDKNSAKLILVGKDISFREIFADDRKQIFDVSGLFGQYSHLETGLLGSHQAVNAATAIGIIEALRLKGIDIPERAIREGLKNVRWPGRLEVAGRRPYLIFDGAQNKASAAALARAIKKIFKYNKLILVMGVSKDKDLSGILEELLAVSDRIILTKSRVVERALDPSEIERAIKRASGKETVVTSGVEEAIRAAFSFASADDLILVTGSLFIVGEVRAICADGEIHSAMMTEAGN